MRSEDEVRREVRRLEFKADQYQTRGRWDLAADAKSDAAMLRWVLDDEEGEIA